jgi:hypothetical protein
MKWLSQLMHRRFQAKRPLQPSPTPLTCAEIKFVVGGVVPDPPPGDGLGNGGGGGHATRGAGGTIKLN